MYEAKVAQAISEQAEEEKQAEKVYIAAVIAVHRRLEKATQACESARSEVCERRAEREQMQSSQDEVVRQLTSLLNAIDAPHKVCTS